MDDNNDTGRFCLVDPMITRVYLAWFLRYDFPRLYIQPTDSR